MVRRPKHIDFKYNFKVYWSILKKYKLLIAVLLLAILVIETIRVVEKYLFKVVIDKGTEFAAGTLLQNQFVQLVILIALVYLGMTLLRAFIRWFHIEFINKLDGNVIKDLKRKMFDHILHLSYNFHTTNKTGSLISRLVRGGSAIERINGVIVFNTAPLVFQLIVAGLSLLYFDWIAAVLIVLIVAAFIGYSFIIQQKQRKSKIEYNNTEDWEKANIADYFTNIDSIKHFGKERTIKGKYESLAESTRRRAIHYWGYYRWLDSGQNIILGVGLTALIGLAVLRLLSGDMTIGTVVFIFTIWGNVMGPVFGFVHGMRQFYDAMGDFESLFTYYRVSNDIKDKKGARDLDIPLGGVKFRRVTFGYHERNIFGNFNLDIKPNSKVALVGHSGSGKSTLVRLLYRLYDLKEGSIKIDGTDISDVKQESLRGNLSLVPQECVLFDDTIYNNIAFARPEASRREVLAAIKFAQLDKIISHFPQGEKTIVGERGVKLSGGEKQRVSIARAILANKKILVLDEATSALDSKTEHDIQEDLKKLMEGRTSIIIAHRLSTIMHADKIVVLEHGDIVQMGTHEELISQPGVYSALWNLQKGGYLPGSDDE